MIFLPIVTCDTSKHAHQRHRRSALNTQYYQIVPNIDRLQVWDSLEEDADIFWDDDIDGDFGMRSPNTPQFRKNVYNSYNLDRGSNRRQRNMKVS